MFDGGASNPPDFPALPDTKVKFFDEAFVLKDPTGMPLAKIPYKIKDPSGEVISKTSENGFSERVSTEASESIEFELQWFKVISQKNDLDLAL